MDRKQIPPGISWIVAGVALIICPFVNRYDTWDTELLAGGIVCCLMGAAWFFAREFMRYHSHHICGVCVIVAGALIYMRGGICIAGGVEGLFLVILGVLILFWPST
ncbi:MAG: hypothetical protein K1W26_12135 [Acetatifactor sp.]